MTCLSFSLYSQLDCSHVFHLQCTRRVLENRWLGPRITFGFMSCPICKVCNHTKLSVMVCMKSKFSVMVYFTHSQHLLMILHVFCS